MCLGCMSAPFVLSAAAVLARTVDVCLWEDKLYAHGINRLITHTHTHTHTHGGKQVIGGGSSICPAATDAYEI